VFHLKVKELLKDLKQRNVFGRYLGHVWTIEYQKWGLPHIHLLLFLHPDDRFLDAIRIDQVVSAELPDPLLDPTGELTKIVQSTMVHGPCGADYPKAPCMVRQSPNDPLRCSKRFPKPFQPITTV
jgi:Helitron helicase-like domain at N-terminus